MPLERYSFGPFLLEVEAFRLLRDGQPVDLQPKQLELLVRLVRSAGELIEREELQACLWPDVVVTEHSLRQLVHRLRHALGPEHEDRIETVPRRGFRFTGPVTRWARTGSPLPTERDLFVGREPDLSALAARFAEGRRLITIVGPGGVGKTRLALRHAHGRTGAACFADLTEARGRDEIARAVGTALDVPLGDDPVGQIGHALAARGACLVLLDNFEQVVALAPDTVGVWLDRAVGVQFLVTSREVLGLVGEEVFALAPLGRDDARTLFETRAASAGHARVGGSPPEVIDALTELLDRLPLAIELAAARASVLSPEEILARMNDRFRLLARPGRGDDRHATLRATLDWSWELLTADERRALAQLTVFEGGFTIRSAEAVLALAETWSVDAVQALVHKSLVVNAPGDRFGLLWSVVEYAREHLSDAEARAVEERHGRALAVPRAFGEAARELDNLVAACRRAIARGDGPVGAATATGAWQVFQRRGPMAAGLELLLGALALPLTPPDEFAVRAEAGVALRKLGRVAESEAEFRSALALALALGDPAREALAAYRLGTALRQSGRMAEARAELERAVARAAAAADRGLEAQALCQLGVLHQQQGRPEDALAALETARSWSRDLGDRRHEGMALFSLGILHREQGRMDQARACAEEAVAIDRELGDSVSEGESLGALASVAMEQGRTDEALERYADALRLLARHGDRRNEGVELGNVGSVFLALGRYDEALDRYRLALAIHREVRNRRHEGVVLGNMGETHARLGRPDEARIHAEEALAIHREVGHRSFEGLVLSLLGSLAADPDEARARFDEAEASARPTGHATLLGTVLVRRAAFEHRADDEGAARRSLAEAEALAEKLGAESQLGREVRELRARLPA